MIRQGDIWWANLGEPIGSTAGYRRPVLVVQGDDLNQSRIATVLCVPLTSNPRWEQAPGNVLLRARETGLERDSVANVSQLLAVDKSVLTERLGHVARRELQRVQEGIDVVLGR